MGGQAARAVRSSRKPRYACLTDDKRFELRLSAVEHRAAGRAARMALMREVIEVLDHRVTRGVSAERISSRSGVLSGGRDVATQGGPGN